MSWMKKNIVWVMFGGVIILFLLNFSMIFFVPNENTRGTFGDQFGAVNALFSGLAFAGLIYTIVLQRRDLELQRHDLKLQRDELALTRQEMEEQTAEFEKQNETLRIQRFENTFFNMLSQFQEVVNTLSAKYKSRGEVIVVDGREIFKAAYEEMPVFIENPEGNGEFRRFKGILNTIKNEGLEGYVKADVPTNFDHYFRLLYRILKFVNESKVITDFDEKYEYTAMLRALLSRYELVWLYYNGLSDYGVEKLKSLIERYAMLKNLRDDLLVDGVDVGSYSESAFRKTRPEEDAHQ
jgi:hypothetical protein